jgi:hypothetical protein
MREEDGGMRDSEKALRAQLLATEHWSLLASRSTTQSEVLSRISMFLYLVSAGLVSLALVGQATKFSDPFPVFAIAVLGMINLVGVLTQIRVINVGMEDLMYVLAMNRLRAAYADLDPGASPYFMASRFDDETGIAQTYYFLLPRRTDFSQVAGSSMVFIIAVNTALLGLLAAVVASLAGAPLYLAAIIGAVLGVIYFAIAFAFGGLRYYRVWKTYEPLNPSPAE